MSPTEIERLQRFVAAQSKLIQELTARLEAVAQIAGPDAVARRRMLELADTVTAKESTPMKRNLSATLLALLVLKSIPAPRPVAVPLPVEHQKTGGSCVS